MTALQPMRRLGGRASAWLPALAFVVLLLLASAPASVLGKPKGSGSGSGGDDVRPAKFRSLTSSASGAISGDSAMFNELTASPRNYSVAVLLTALQAQFGCEPCAKFQPQYDAIANSWKKTNDGSHFFVTLDFTKGKEIFQRLGLQHAPALYFFSPTSGPRAAADGVPEQYDFNRAGFDGDDFASWLADSKGIKVTYAKPFPWRSALAISTSAIAVGGAVMYLAPHAGGLLSGSKILWELVTLAVVIVMCSGYMWNQIRGAPYSGRGQGGKIEYFANGFSNQFAAETQIVASIYALLAFSVVALTIFVPGQKDPIRQRAGVYIWSAVFLGTFSLLFAIFRIKNPAYPFRLFL